MPSFSRQLREQLEEPPIQSLEQLSIGWIPPSNPFDSLDLDAEIPSELRAQLTVAKNEALKAVDRLNWSLVVADRREEPPNAAERSSSAMEPPSSTTTTAATAAYGPEWLVTRAQNIAQQQSLPAQDIAMKIVRILRENTRTQEQVQSDLADLLGFDDWQFLSDLVAHRSTIVQSCGFLADVVVESGFFAAGGPVMPPLASMKRLPSLPSQEFRKDTANPATPLPVRPPGIQFTIATESERREQKERRKLDKKVRKTMTQQEESVLALAQELELDGEELRQLRDQMLLENANRPLFTSDVQFAPDRVKYPHVYDTTFGVGGMQSVSIYGTGFALPAGAERREHVEYEEIEFPIKPTPPRPDTERIVTIEDLEAWARPVFRGYKSLNRIQSIVYPTAYQTNENMLVCAPTGAGKTDVAMLTVLATIKQYMSVDEETSRTRIERDQFKIVYVAPMKALAAEVVRKFGARLQCLGIAVRELTGDMQLSKSEILATQMIVTTPEKWDVVTRKSTGKEVSFERRWI